MKKYFLFLDDENDIAMYDVDRLQSVTCAADETILMKFAPGSLGEGQAASVDVVTLTTTAGAAKEGPIFQAIARAANATGPQYSDGLITVCDDINSVFLHADILSCAIALDA
jgi:hypothetical protein